jgi:hypothetical protein
LARSICSPFLWLFRHAAHAASADIHEIKLVLEKGYCLLLEQKLPNSENCCIVFLFMEKLWIR